MANALDFTPGEISVAFTGAFCNIARNMSWITLHVPGAGGGKSEAAVGKIPLVFVGLFMCYLFDFENMPRSPVERLLHDWAIIYNTNDRFD